MIGLFLMMIIIIFGVILFKKWTAIEHKKRVNAYEEIKKAMKRNEYDAVDQFDRTLLMQAIKNDFSEIIDVLLKKTVELERSDQKDETALFYAVRYKNIECLEKLISKGVRVNHINADGVTALWYAAQKSDSRYAKILTDAGISLDDQDQTFLLSPIMVSIKNRHLDTMKVLYEAGADLTLKSKEGDIKSLLKHYVIPNLKGDSRKAHVLHEVIRQMEAKINNEVFTEMSYETFEKMNAEKKNRLD
jgi:ankyrin repeat protein